MRRITATSMMAVALLGSGPLSAQADRKLSSGEVRMLFSGRTFDGVNEKTGQPYVAYPAPDGVHNLAYPDGRKLTGKWHVNEVGQHCVELPTFSSCADVHDKGNGVYQRVDGGVVSHTLRNFRDGDQR